MDSSWDAEGSHSCVTWHASGSPAGTMVRHELELAFTDQLYHALASSSCPCGLLHHITAALCNSSPSNSSCSCPCPSPCPCPCRLLATPCAMSRLPCSSSPEALAPAGPAGLQVLGAEVGYFHHVGQVRKQGGPGLGHAGCMGSCSCGEAAGCWLLAAGCWLHGPRGRHFSCILPVSDVFYR